MAALRSHFDRIMGITSRTSRVAVVLTLAVLVVHWTLMVWFVVPRLGTLGFVRLHYTATLGVDWVARWPRLFTFPVAGTLIAVMNTALAAVLVKRTPRIDAVIHSTTAVVELMLATAGVIALLLNG